MKNQQKNSYPNRKIRLGSDPHSHKSRKCVQATCLNFAKAAKGKTCGLATLSPSSQLLIYLSLTFFYTFYKTVTFLGHTHVLYIPMEKQNVCKIFWDGDMQLASSTRTIITDSKQATQCCLIDVLLDLKKGYFFSLFTLLFSVLVGKRARRLRFSLLHVSIS